MISRIVQMMNATTINAALSFVKIFMSESLIVDLLFSWHIVKPDLASQITAHKAKKTSNRNNYDLA